MSTKILGLRRAVVSFPQISSLHYNPVRTYRVHQDCDAHMNELPIPCGPWDPWYKEKQRFYNKIFVGGILWFIFSFAMMYRNSLYLNCSPPALPGPPSDMVIECDDSE